MTLTIEQGADRVIDLCAGVRKDEKVVVICDDSGDPALAAAVASSARRRGADVKEITVSSAILAAAADENDFPAEAMAADVLIGATGVSIYHSALGRSAAAAGARVLAMTGCDINTLIRGAIEADFDATEGPCLALAARLTSAQRIRVTTAAGTDLTASIAGREGFTCTGKAVEPGSRTGFPDIEAFIAPVEDSVNGRIVIDASTTSLGLVDASLVLTVENGKLDEIEGGEHATAMAALLAQHGPSAHIFAEFGFGMNPSANVIGNIIEDEATYGTGHIAFGSNNGFGGANSSTIHQDFVYWHPTVELDGTVVMEHGSLII